MTQSDAGTVLTEHSFKPLRCLVLSLGGGNETAQQSGKNATSQDAEAPQRAKSCTPS